MNNLKRTHGKNGVPELKAVKTNLEVHLNHCCLTHGCKYGDGQKCPVESGKYIQLFPCEECHHEQEDHLRDSIAAHNAQLNSTSSGVKGPFTRPTAPAEPSVACFTHKVCDHPSHKPPSYIWCRQGDVHTHTCPGCGEVTYLTIVRYNHDPRKD